MNTEHVTILLSGVGAWNQWRRDNPGITPNLCGANLHGANLQGANLQGANLCGANLYEANLHGANLHGADLDFSCWPLWCGSKNVKVDVQLVRQLCAHICVLDNDSQEFRAIKKALLKYAKKSHRAVDLGLRKGD